MAKINFDTLPSDNPKGLLTKACYRIKINGAEMKKSDGKPDYLSLVYDAFDIKTKKSKGKLFDIISEPNHDITKYKLFRFITALKIPMSGEFELKDLVKIIKNKELYADITIQTDEKYGDKNVIDVFTGEVFYPIDKIPAHVNLEASEDAEIPSIAQDEIDAIDAADAGTPSDANEPESEY